MAKTTKIESIWKNIRKKAQSAPIADGDFNLVRIDATSAADIYAGIDALCSSMIAIGVHSKPPALEIESSSFDYFRVQRQQGFSWLMILRLTDIALEPVFGRLCQDLYEEAASLSGEAQLISLFMDRLVLWKRLFEQGSGALLSKHQIMGLVGEMLVLEAELQAGRSAHEAVMAWIGPKGADQDFRFSTSAVEVKTTGPDSSQVTISSLDQLSADVPICLAIVRIRPASATDPAVVTLNSMAARLEEQISSSPPALAAFRVRLLEAGYVEEARYDELHLQPVSRTDYEVGAAFPRLTRVDVPAAVSGVTYTLKLDELDAFIARDVRYDE
jgi:hypothetical protein